jgi:hypothetical protein
MGGADFAIQRGGKASNNSHALIIHRAYSFNGYKNWR